MIKQTFLYPKFQTLANKIGVRWEDEYWKLDEEYSKKILLLSELNTNIPSYENR